MLINFFGLKCQQQFNNWTPSCTTLYIIAISHRSSKWFSRNAQQVAKQNRCHQFCWIEWAFINYNLTLDHPPSVSGIRNWQSMRVWLYLRQCTLLGEPAYDKCTKAVGIQQLCFIHTRRVLPSFNFTLLLCKAFHLTILAEVVFAGWIPLIITNCLCERYKVTLVLSLNQRGRST